MRLRPRPRLVPNVRPVSFHGKSVRFRWLIKLFTRVGFPAVAGVAASGYADGFVEVEYQDAVVVELGFEK